MLAAGLPQHMVGNDRVIAYAMFDGTLGVRQDEGGPKILTNYAPDTHQFRGGLYVSNVQPRRKISRGERRNEPQAETL